MQDVAEAMAIRMRGHAVRQPVGLGAITRGTDKPTNGILLVTLCLSSLCTQVAAKTMALVTLCLWSLCTQDVAKAMTIRMRCRAVFTQYAS
jgi:hypothetical protein